MKKLILTSIMILLTAQSFAGGSDIDSGDLSKLSCRIGVLTATSNVENLDNSMPADIKTVVLNTENEASFALESKTGQKAEFLIFAADYPENKMIELRFSMNISNEEQQFNSMILSQKKNSNEFSLLEANSMQNTMAHIKPTGTVLNKLKKYNVTSGFLSNPDALNDYYETIAEAVRNGDLKEGEIIGSIVLNGCTKK